MTTAQVQEDGTGQNDLEKVLVVLRRRAWLIILCVVVAGGAAFGFSKLQQKEYSASASLLFRNPGFAEDLFGTSAPGFSNDPTREAATNEKLVGLAVVGGRAARFFPELSAGEVSRMVSVSAQGEADLVSVTATNPDPVLAMRVANTFARQFIAFRASTEKAKLLEAKKLAEEEFGRLSPQQQNGPRGQALSRSAEKLGILASLQTGNAELVQPARVPTSPSSPKPLRNTVIGAVLGLILGLGLAFGLERLNRKLREPEEVRAAFDVPLLATIPQSKEIDDATLGVADDALPFAANEAFRMLRASLRYFNIDHELRAVMVTADTPEVGKSTVAWNLGRLAAAGTNVVVVEADLRNPSFQRGPGLSPGLAEFLTGQAPLDEVIQTRPLNPHGQDQASAGSIDVITAGSVPPNPAELLESHVMSDLISTLGTRYDLVVIDTPPLAVVSDALPLIAHVDGVLIVVRMGRTARDAAVRLIEQLQRFKAPILGVVANGVKQRKGRKYAYGYGYYGDGGSRRGEPGANGAAPPRDVPAATGASRPKI
jgi:capsular exopolysaccharide synthesis family protein